MMKPHGSDPTLLRDATRVRVALRELVRVSQSRDREWAHRFNLSSAQFQALQVLSARGPLRVNDLAAHLHLEKSTASRLAHSLVDGGLVRKRVAPADGRILMLHLTEVGHRLALRIDNTLNEEFSAILGRLADGVRERLPENLKGLAAALERDP